MLKIGKKVLSLILVLCLMCSMFSVSAFAANDETGNNQGVQADVSDGMEVRSNNSFGNLLTSEFEQEMDKQEENNGNNVFSVEVEGKIATVEFETVQDSTLVVAIYDESGVEMLASGSADVTVEDTTAEVTIDIKTMPTYFYLKAFLIDKEVYRPLCTVYESPNYTQEMQEFFAKTTDDFASDKVLNLDDDETNNFAVYGEDVKQIEKNGEINKVVSADDENKIYLIENADSSITSLKEGEIFSYQYSDDETLIVKVKSISVSGTTVTIYGDDTDINEVFDYVKIESTADTYCADYDPSTCDDGVTYKGTETEVYNDKSPVLVSGEAQSSMILSHSYTIDKTVKSSSGIVSNSVKITGGVDLLITATAKVYISWTHQYLEFKLDCALKYSVSISGTLSLSIPLGSFGISPIPGVYIDFTPSFVVEATVQITLSSTINSTVGISVSNKNGIRNISSAPKIKTELKIEGIFFIGLSLEPRIKVLGSTITGTLTAKIGVEVYASLIPGSNKTGKSIHECNICISGSISPKLTLSASIMFLKNDDWKFGISNTFKIKLWDFYYSKDFNEFAFTTCPHYKYMATVTVKDENGNAVSGATVFGANAKTDSNGRADIYLHNGRNEVFAEHNGLTGKTIIYIENAPASATVVIEKKVIIDDIEDDDPTIPDIPEITQDSSLSLGENHSGMITENGDLYMWGANDHGQLGYDTDNNISNTPKKIESDVKFKAVSLGDSHSGAITENGDLYMWGSNDKGQLGDGSRIDSFTPKKIESDVKFKAVSLGGSHSGAITENGDLYMWGSNDYGQLGYDTTNKDSCTPKMVKSNVKCISLGKYNSAAITENGDLYMWGSNGEGQLGDGKGSDSLTPRKIMSNVKSVSLGAWHSAAITENGDLYTWGANFHGQLGNGQSGPLSGQKTPQKIMSDVYSVSLGHEHSSAITTDGDLYMWGKNCSGQLGDGTDGIINNSTTPKKVLNNIKEVSLGKDYSAAKTLNNDLYMWGLNDLGQLGDGTTIDKSVPTKITIPTLASYNLLKSAGEVSVSEDCKTETFTDLHPNEVYNFYSMKAQNASVPFGAANLLYITQATTDENGNLSVNYIPDVDYDNAVNFVVPLKQTDLSTADVTMDNLTYNGEIQYIAPVVTFEGKTLVEGEDYNLHGDYRAKDSGKYTVIIKGRGFYTGEIVFNYSLVSSEKILGDVNGDSNVDIKDTTMLQKYLAGLVSFSDEQLALADTNGDGSVTVLDATQIQKYLANLVTQLG